MLLEYHAYLGTSIGPENFIFHNFCKAENRIDFTIFQELRKPLDILEIGTCSQSLTKKNIIKCLFSKRLLSNTKFCLKHPKDQKNHL